MEPSSILDQKIREFSKKTQDVSVDEFKDYFWQLFRMASNTNNLEMCKNLLRAVPNALKDEAWSLLRKGVDVSAYVIIDS